MSDTRLISEERSLDPPNLDACGTAKMVSNALGFPILSESKLRTQLLVAYLTDFCASLAEDMCRMGCLMIGGEVVCSSMEKFAMILLECFLTE